MSSYFSKLKGAVSSVAKQGATILTGISNVATSSAPSSSETSISGKNELIQLYDQFCSIVDRLANLPNAESIDIDLKLTESNARPIFRRIIKLLQIESELWIEHQRLHIQQLQSSKKHIEDIEIPCLEYVLQSNMIQGFVNRALTDTPRGLMPLVLTGISHMLRSIEYPLLPHQSVYKSVAKLISFASRYEFVITAISAKDEEQYLSYRRRIEIGLTSLLRTIWRKIVDNPPVLEFFILTDTRRVVSSVPEISKEKHFVRMQIDILTGLFPMVLEPKVSYYVQETLLTALSIGDTRIISFLTENTKFPELVVKLVCESFRESFSVIQSFIQEHPQQSLHQLFFATQKSQLAIFFPNMGTANSSFGGIPVTPYNSKNPKLKENLPQPFQSPPQPLNGNPIGNTINAASSSNPNAKMDPLEKFTKSILLMKAIYSNLRQQHHTLEAQLNLHLQKERNLPSTDGNYDSSSNKFDVISSNKANLNTSEITITTTNSTIPNENTFDFPSKKVYLKKLELLFNKISFFYYYEFLSGMLLPSLETTTNETQTMIYYYLLRILLLSLHDNYQNQPGVDDNSFSILSNPQKNKQNKRRKSGSSSVPIAKAAVEHDANSTVLEHDSSNDLLQELFPNEALLSLTLKSLFITHAHYSRDNSDAEESKFNILSKKSYFQHHNNWFILLDRTTSMSKTLSMIATDCIQTIFQIAPPIFLMELQSIQPIRITQREYDQFLPFLKNTTSSIGNGSNSQQFSTPTKNNNQNLKPTNAEIWSLRLLDDYQSSFQEVLRKLLTVPLVQDGKLESSPNYNAGLSAAMIAFSSREVLKRLYHQGDSSYFLHYSRSHLSSSSFALWWEYLINTSSSSTDAQSGSALASSSLIPSTEIYSNIYNDMIIDRFYRRLQSYFTMSIDEQLYFAQLLYQQYLPIAVLIIVQKNELLCKQQLLLLIQFHKKIQYLLEEMEKKYFKQIHEVDQKLLLFRQYLWEEANEILLKPSPPAANSPSNNGKLAATPAKVGNHHVVPKTDLSTPSKVTTQQSIVTPNKTPSSSIVPNSLFRKSLNFIGSNTSSHGENVSTHSGRADETLAKKASFNSTHGLTDASVHAEPSGTDVVNIRDSLKTDIQKETAQQQSILTGYIILQEMSYELQSIFYTIDDLKTLFTADMLQFSSSTLSSTTFDSNSFDGSDLLLTGSEDQGDSTIYYSDRNAWKKMIINEYEEDEQDLIELKQLLQTVSNINSKNDAITKEIEFIEEFHQLSNSLEQMVSV